MKQFVCLVCAISFVVSSFAQPPSLFISANKTTSLIFPFPIKHVDRGTKDVLVQQLKEADNILLVKAASAGFAETNLSVITGDGSLYTFSVCYDNHPTVWVYQLPVQLKASMTTYANAILDNPATVRGIQHKKWDVEAKVIGIYIKNEILYYQIEFSNKSPIDYTVEYLRFYIRDQKAVKRTSIQEIELTPLHIAGNTSQVKANGKSTIVIALDRFIIPDRKYFGIEIGEGNGGRNLSLRLNNKNILRALTLPDLR